MRVAANAEGLVRLHIRRAHQHGCLSRHQGADNATHNLALELKRASPSKPWSSLVALCHGRLPGDLVCAFPFGTALVCSVYGVESRPALRE